MKETKYYCDMCGIEDLYTKKLKVDYYYQRDLCRPCVNKLKKYIRQSKKGSNIKE